MADVVLIEVPAPDLKTMTIFARPDEPPCENQGAFIQGSGDTNFLCANCELVLVEGAAAGQVSNIVFRCPRCGAYSRSRV